MTSRLRLATGVVLFSYLLCHLLNHSMGLISVRAMQAGLGAMTLVWHNAYGETVLYAALLGHLALALGALWRRRSLRMPLGEAAQLVLGFAIPALLIPHIVGTFLTLAFYGANIDYNAKLLWYYVESPAAGLAQAVLLVIAWSHGCIGLRYNLRLRRWYPRVKWLLFAAALLIPALSLLGFYEGGRSVARAARDPAWIRTVAEPRPLPPDGSAQLDAWCYGLWLALAFAVAAVLTGRLVRQHLKLQHGAVTLTYPDGRKVRVPAGTSVLEASRMAGIPHAAICGGHGRCSTCRVRVAGDPDAIPVAETDEQRVLQAIGAPANVRLACQLRPSGDLQVTPILPPDVTAKAGVGKVMAMQGVELEIAIMFCDIRSFTKLAEHMLPYDTVFLLNRYFAVTGRSIEEAGGRVDKFLGDGVMALFGIEGGPVQGCRAALAAASGIALRLEHLNEILATELKAPIRIGIGLHVGRTIVGEMGYGKTVTVTAIGDAVNTASRLEDETKQFGVQLVVSDAVAALAGVDLSGFPARELDIRGREETLAVRLVPSAKDLPAIPAAKNAATVAPAHLPERPFLTRSG
jgi:adenylate cyclase